MWRLFFALAVCSLVFQAGCSQTVQHTQVEESLDSLPQYSGTLLGTTEWRGDVVMAADVRIPAGSQLVIHPGTRVYVRAAQGTKIDPEYLSSATELLIQGELTVGGSTDDPVVFEPFDVPTDADYGWAGIELIGAKKTRISGTFLRNAETGILSVGSSPVVSDNRLNNCRYGIIVQQDSVPQIKGNLIEDGEGGIFCWRASRPVLHNNRIVAHAEEGLHVDSSSRPQLGMNIVQGNDIGIYLGTKGVDFSQLQFSDNRIDVHLSHAVAAGAD